MASHPLSLPLTSDTTSYTALGDATHTVQASIQVRPSTAAAGSQAVLSVDASVQTSQDNNNGQPHTLTSSIGTHASASPPMKPHKTILKRIWKALNLANILLGAILGVLATYFALRSLAQGALANILKLAEAGNTIDISNFIALRALCETTPVSLFLTYVTMY